MVSEYERATPLPDLPPGTIIEVWRVGTDERDGGGCLVGVCGYRNHGKYASAEHISAAEVAAPGADSVGGLVTCDNLSHTQLVRFSAVAGLPANGVRPGTGRLARMADALRARGLRPHVWDGSRVLPLG